MRLTYGACGMLVGMTTVDRLTEDDWTVLRDLRLASLDEPGSPFVSDAPRERRFVESHWRMRTRASVWFVARRESVPVGLIGVTNEPGAPADDRHLTALWVAPGDRRRGHGGALVDAGIDWAAKDLATTMSLWIAEDDAAGGALLWSRGFEPSPGRHAMAHDQQRAEIRWTRRVAA